MFRGLIVILLLSMIGVGQSDKTPSDTTRTFLQTVANGEFESADVQVYRLLIVDGKVFGPLEAQPTSTALKVLHDSGYEYHKELSIETASDVSRVYVEMVRGSEVDLFEILLIRSGKDWKISGWRRVSPPVEIPRPPSHPSFPNGVPFRRPCPRCV